MNDLGVLKFLRVCLCMFVCSQVAFAETKYVAVIPPLIESAWSADERQTAADFQNALQAELYKGYDLQIVSRSQLSTIAFENKARLLKNPELRKFNVIPCQNIVLSVYRAKEKSVSIFAIENKKNTKPGKAIEISVKGRKDVLSSAKKAADLLAKRLKISPRKAKVITAIGKKGKLVAVAINSSTKDSLTSEFAPQMEYLADQLTICLQEAADQGNDLQLIDRKHLADVMAELKISEADITTELSPVDIQGADLILQPVVFSDGSKLHNVISAIDPQTSVILNMADVDPDALDVKAVQKFIADSISYKSKNTISDEGSLRLRDLESQFYANQLANLLGLRMSEEGKRALKFELAQASVGLCADDLVRTQKALGRVISKVSGSSLPESYKEEYKRHLFLAVEELENVFNLQSTFVQSKFWATLGDEAKSLECVTRDEAAGYRAKLYESEARALYNLKRYQECVDLVLARKRFSTYTMFLVTDSYKNLGQFEKEQELLYRNIKSAGKSISRLFRVLTLTRKYKGPEKAIYFWAHFAHKWARLHPKVLMELAECYIDTGEKEFAADIYQSILWRAKTDNKQLNEAKPFIESAKSSLKQMGISEKSYREITPASVLNLDKSTSVEVITDDSIPLVDVQKACQEFSDFWGLEIHIYYNTINFTESDSYDPVRKTLDIKPVTMALNHHSEMKSATSVQRYFLTRKQLISIRKNGYRGSVFSSYGMNYGLYTTHYINKFKGYDKRPLEHITAIMMGGVDVIRRASEQNGDRHVLRIPPYIFSNNSNLSFHEHRLTISHEAASLLKNLSLERLITKATELRELDRKRARENPLTDTKFIQNASQQYLSAKPLIISPK